LTLVKKCIMKVFCTRKIPNKGAKMIEKAGHELTYWTGVAPPTQEELIAACQNIDVLVVADSNKLNSEFLHACSHLKLIALHSIGYNHVDVKVAKELNIPVSHTPGAGTRETADTAFFLMLAVSKKAFSAHERIRNGEWRYFNPTANLGTNLRGKTLGVFGLGNIGFEMARLSKA